MRSEPVPLYQEGDSAYYKGKEIVILQIHTYCLSCDHFFDQAAYTLKAVDDSFSEYRVKEDKIKFSLEG